MMNKVDEAYIREYLQVKRQLNTVKKKELEMRKAILEAQFPTASEGTQHAFVGGYAITGRFSYNVSIDQSVLEEMSQFFTDEEKECISYAPKLSMAKYKELASSIYIDECLTFKPALPSISIDLTEKD